MNNYTTLTRYKAATPRSARRQKGYTVPTFSLPSGNSVSLGGVVMLSGEQTITSIKDFLAGLKIGGLSVYKSQADTIYLDANLVVRGGITAFGTNETITPSIFEALPIDGITLKRTENGVLYVASGGSGGSNGGGISIEDLESYLTTNGYATQSWVTGRGYITSSALEPYALKTAIPTKLSQLTDDVGYFMTKVSADTLPSLGNIAGYGYENKGWKTTGPAITFGISTYKAGFQSNYSSGKLYFGFAKTSGESLSGWKIIAFTSDIPTSLKNPNALSWSGYSSGSYDGSTVQSITIPNNTNQLTNGAGFITASASITGNAATATLASTLGGGHPSGASNKLSYLSGQFAPNTTPTAGQIYIGSSEVWGVISVPKLDGTTSNANAMSLRMAFNTKFWHEIAASPNDNNLYHRNVRNGVGNAWSTILNSTNYSDYALPKDGTAVAASKLATTRSIWGNDFDGSAPISGNIIGKTPTWSIISGEQNIIRIATTGTIITPYDKESGWVAIRTGAESTTNGSKEIRVLSSGNVAIGGTTAAEKLEVYGNVKASGNLIGKDADVSGALNLTSTTSSAFSGAQLLFSGGISRIGVSSGGSMYVYAKDFTFRPSSTTSASSKGFTIDANANLATTGNILATGGITATNSSDERLKRNLRKFNASKVLMSLGGVYEYEYIDSEVQKNHIYEGTHYGLIYQHVKGTTLDVMCHERKDGMGALNYIHPKFISLIAGATMENISEVEKLKRKIRTLEEKVKQLEQRA